MKINSVLNALFRGLPVLTGLLLLLAYPPYGLAALGWTALVPLLWHVLSQRKALGGTDRSRNGIRQRSPVGFSLAGGLLWGIGLFYPLLWIEEGEWIERIGGVAILALLTALILGLFAATATRISWGLSSGRRWLVIPAFASLWVSLEYLIRAVAVGFSTYLGVTQWRVPAMLAVASVGGVYAVTWLMVAVNTAIALLTLVPAYKIFGGSPPIGSRGYFPSRRSGYTWARQKGRMPRRRWLSLGVGAATLVALLTGGQVGPFTRLESVGAGVSGESRAPAVLAAPLHLMLVQPHITPSEYLEARSGIPAQRRLWEKVLEQVDGAVASLKEEAASSRETLVVLPETFVHYTAADDPLFGSRFTRFAREAGINWMIGIPRSVGAATGSEGTGAETGGERPPKERNAAFFIGRDGSTKAVYDKIYVIPIAEDHFAPGGAIGLLDIGGHRLGIGICSDVVVPDHALATLRAGAGSLHYIASLAHIGDIAQLERAFVVFRAAEHGVYVTQTATTGPTIVVDPSGRIIQQAAMGEPDEIVVDIPPDRLAPTPYTRFGDWVVLVSALVVLAHGLAAMRSMAGFAPRPREI